MSEISTNITKQFLLKNIPAFRVGDYIKVYQKIKEGKKDKEIEHRGLVISRKHGKGIDASFSIRHAYQDVGVEKTFPLHLPSIVRIEVLKRAQKVKTAKLYWTREKTEKEIRKRLKFQDQKEEQ